MVYRLTRAAEDQIDALLLESARDHGLEAAGRYGQLILVVMAALGDDPQIIGSVDVPRLRGVLAFPIRLLRQRAEPACRVGSPRHLIVYGRGTDAVVEILGLVHDRMVLPEPPEGSRVPATKADLCGLQTLLRAASGALMIAIALYMGVSSWMGLAAMPGTAG